MRVKKNISTRLETIADKGFDIEQTQISYFSEDGYVEREGLLESAFTHSELQYSDGQLVYNGTDDMLPLRLMSLYKKSNKHGSLINKKARFVAGKGFEGNKKYNNAMRSCALDLEIYNCFYLEIIRNKLGAIQEVNHVPYNWCRSDRNNKIFFIGRFDIIGNTKSNSILEAFEANNKDQISSIYMHRGFDIENNTYPTPKYIQAINYIIADAALGDHVKTQTSNGFAPSRVVHFVDGAPKTKEAKDDKERRFKEKFSGPYGKKIAFTWSRNPDVRPIIEDLGDSDMSKEDYTNINNLIRENIFAAHEVISPILFGIATAGSLGSKNEMMEAYNVYKTVYIDNVRIEIEESFNKIDPSCGKIIDSYDSMLSSISEDTGIDVSDKKKELNLDETINIFKEYGRKKNEFIVEEKFESIYDSYKYEIVQKLKQDPSLKVEILADLMNKDVGEIKQYISELKEAGYLDKNNKVLKNFNTPKWNRSNTIVESVYSYELRKEVSGQPEIIPTSRDFCRELIKLDRFYTRQEIEGISARLGYDVFNRAGGFWGSKPHCRHEWRRQSVVRTINN
jgi:hypothetical protein